MAEFKYTLINTRTSERLLCDPSPTGWEKPVIALERDDRWHGMFFDYGVNTLNFTRQPAAFIKQEYDNYGVSGQMELIIDYRCSDGQFTELYHGKLDFVQYQESCGTECFVSIELEDAADIMQFRNNYTQQVDLNSNIAFDKTTVLQDYDRLNFDMIIPSRGLPVRTAGQSIAQQHPIYPITVVWPGIANAVYIRPIFTQNVIDEIPTADLQGGLGYGTNQVLPTHPSGIIEILDLELPPQCSSGVFTYNVRLKGHLQETTNAPHTVTIQAVATNLNDYDNIADPALSKITILPTTAFGSGGGPDLDFDANLSGTATLTAGQQFRAFIFLASTPNAALRTQNIWVDWDAETSVTLSTVTLCEESEAKVSMINEAASRCVEAITNDGIRFYSQTFGRIDSQPYPISNDTCPGLFAITNGLNIRRKLLPDNTQPGFFKTMEQLFEELNSLWHIGLTIETDPQRTGFKRLRFEDWRYFYQNDIGIVFPKTDVRKRVDPNRVFNRISVGFNKWEAEQTSGLDEFMTNRDYRLNISSIDNSLEVKTDLIGSPYTIEITRRQFDTSKDWKYDNDTMGFCLVRDGADFSVEQFQGTTTGVVNVIDPDTAYNARIRPSVIAMRWFNFFVQGVKVITSNTRMIFTKGVGNYIARLKTNFCNIEGQPISENEDIDITDFNVVSEANPITQPEIDAITVPLNFNTFKRLLRDPLLKFKSVRYFCNESVYEGWIKSLQYRLDDGIADIQIIPKNYTQIPIPIPPCSATIELGTTEVTVTDAQLGTISVDFTEGVLGADNWRWRINDFNTSDLIQQGTTNVHPFIISGLAPGQYRINLVPYCGENIGVNSVTIGFEIELPFELELSAILTQGLDPNNRLRLTATGSAAAPNNISFDFGYCTTNTSSSLTYCEGYVGASGGGSGTTLTLATGNTTVTQNSTNATPGANFGYINSIVLYNISGISQSQIKKAAGQAWTLIFQ